MKRRKNRTRAQRKQRITRIIEVLAVIACILILELGCARSAASEEPVTGEAYLESVGADQQHRAEMMELWESWE